MNFAESAVPAAVPEASLRHATVRSCLDRSRELVDRMLRREGTAADPGTVDPRALRARLPLELSRTGESESAVFERVAAVMAATPSTSSWRFVNQLFGGREPVALATELVAAAANVSMYTFKAAGAQVLVEAELIRHMASLAGMRGAEGTFTPGGSIANLVALLLARDARWPSTRSLGLGASSGAVYTSAEGHYSVTKAAAILGLGRSCVRAVPVDRHGRMDVGRLVERMDADAEAGTPALAVVATAGTTVRGAFDPIDELATVAHARGAWLHVDGALGASFALSRRHGHRLRGIECADSVAWNPHKLMGVGLQSSLLLVRTPGVLARSLDENADYLFQTHVDEFDPGHRSIQCGRRNDALRLWATWLRLGDAGFEARIDRLVALAEYAASAIAANPVFELHEPPASVNVCFRVRGVDGAAICDRLYRSGRLSIGHGLAGGTRVIRLPCVDPELGEGGIDRVLEEIQRAAASPT